MPLASVLLTAGSMSDRWGARRLFAASLATFTAASLLCAVSPTLHVLIVARFAQGLAAGGLLTDLLGWRAIFAINIPIGLVTILLALRHVAETPRRQARADLPGQVAAAVALAAVTAWLIEGGPLGWGSAVPLGLLALGTAATAAFLLIERHSGHPMLPLAVFRRSAFSASVGSGLAFQFAGYGMQFMLALHLQQHWSLGPARTGVWFLPFSIAWVFGTIVINRRLIGLGPRALLWSGALVSAAGAMLLLGVAGPGTWPLFLAGTTLAGLGCGVFSPSLNAAALQAIDPAYAGLGSGVLNTARQAGMAMGVALLGSLVSMRDAALGVHLGAALLTACFLTIVWLSLRYLPGRSDRLA
ncbi:MFS transporter [Nonomuraea sp. NPDC005501]|uniref:MFS transporter n=1 Tax=Nonomuraea sp. NPDC005501 TaxID=3156884 RepID=UPI0033B5A398